MKISKTFKILLSASIVSLFLSATPVSAARVHVYPRAVVIQKGHVHTVRCGHYYYRGQWYFLPAHVHGPRCGHVLVHGVWLVR